MLHLFIPSGDNLILDQLRYQVSFIVVVDISLYHWWEACYINVLPLAFN